MSLRDEALEVLARVMDEGRCPRTAACIRAEDWTGDGLQDNLKTARAVLSLIDEWEEVEVQLADACGSRWRVRSSMYWDRATAPFTILRRKPEPTPDVEELARRAVKAYREPRCTAYDEAMEALEKKLDR